MVRLNAGIRKNRAIIEEKKKHSFLTILIFMRISLRHLSAGGVVFFGSAVIILGVLQMRTYLTEPYADKEQSETSSELSSHILASRDVQDLHLLDSDKDGISDFDELNVYKTSPYLADTDSDGISDKVEIDAFDDPNCPAGYVCAEVVEGDLSQETERPMAQETVIAPLAPQSTGTDIPDSAGLLVLQDLLNESGAGDQPVLQTGTNEHTTEQGAASAPGTVSDISFEDLTEKDLLQVRELLIQRGVEKSVLDSFFDDELKLLLEEIIKEEQSAGAHISEDNLSSQ